MRSTVYSRALSLVVLIRIGCVCLDICLSRSRVRIPMSFDAMCGQALVGACVARSSEIVMGMPSSSTVRVSGCTNITRNDPNARLSNLFYVPFASSFAECVAAADRGGRSTSTMSPGMNVEATRISLSQSRLYSCLLARMRISALNRRT